MWYRLLKKAQTFFESSGDLSSRSKDWFFSGESSQNETNSLSETIQEPVEKVETVSENWLENAKSWLGTPYKFGGESKKGIDCSAFIQKVFPERNLPRTADDQMQVGTPIEVSDISSWLPGDRVYFDMGSRLGSGNNVADHTGIYIGNNQFIQASSSKGVTISDISPNSFYYKKVIAVKR